ncbi:MAG: glutamate-cysteine ligase family protein [Candidatus Thorarchaeota archaeon]
MTDICREYRVLCGIEEEFLLINEDGSLAQQADDTMLAAAEMLRGDQKRLARLRLKIRALDPEPSRAQIEYTTLPTPPTSIRDFVIEGRRLISDAAQAAGCLAFCQSLHSFESRPNPMAGTHINVSVRRQERLMTPEEQVMVYNHCWNHLPELIAASANSPIIFGQETGIISNRIARSRVLRRNPVATLQIPEKQSQLVQQSYYGRLRYALKIGSDETEPLVIMNSQGNRLTDITARGPYTNIDQDRDETPLRNRVEIRIFDVQTDSERLVDLCYLCCGLALHATSCLGEGLEIKPDPYHDENIKRAVRDGLDATLVTLNGTISARKSINELAEEIQPYLRLMGVRFIGSLARSPPTISQRSPTALRREMQTFERLYRSARRYLIVRTGRQRTAMDPRTGQRYSVPNRTRLFGTLQARHRMKLEKGEYGLIKNFKEADPAYYLVVKGVPILMDQRDSVETAMTEEEYVRARIMGRF